MGNIMQQKRDFLIDALHIFVLFSFALAQPLFDLLSRNAEFFVARRSEPVDVVLLIVILCVLLPVFVLLTEVLAGFFGRRARKGVHTFIVAALLTAIALQAAIKIFEFPGTVLLVGAVFMGVVVTIAYICFHPVRTFLTVLSPAVLVFPCLFLFNCPVSKIVFADDDSSGVYDTVDATAPVIMVVFDEFPVTSLMDEHRGIDPIRYPNFAALARGAFWFRNATTVSDHTHIAIPAMLTGKYPDGAKLPTATDYPKNIFTLLGGSYDFEVFESITKLCPERLSARGNAHVAERIGSLLTDLTVVYLHILLPRDLATGLPVITQTWKDFTTGKPDFRDNTTNENPAFLDGIRNLVKVAGKEMKKDRGEVFRQFIRSIHSNKKPSLYFLHILLPHVPYEYLPSGRTYSTNTGITGLNSEKWCGDERVIIQAYQRFLLQLGFVDTLLGEFMDHLKGIDLYDRSLIIITADHGVSFRANDSRRPLTETNFQDIVSIPLFIKVPNQREAIISDRNVELIDILPTIADILGIRLSWPVDGHTAIDISLPERTEKVVFAKQTAEDRHIFETTPAAKYKTVERKLALFGSGAKPDGLFKIGPHNNLVGQHVMSACVTKESGVGLELDLASCYERVDPEARFVPAHITGRLHMSGRKDSPLNLAIAVNGTVSAVTRTFDNKRGEAKFSVIVPESSFHKGKNEVEVFVVSEGDGQLQLLRTKSRSTLTYFLAESSEHSEIITSSNGRSIRVIPNALKAHLDIVDVRKDHFVLSGWAADVKNSQLAEAIMIFADGEFFYSGRCNLDRPDLVKAFDNAALQGAGFSYLFPLSVFKNITNSEVRIFAVSKTGKASELKYPKEYKWCKKS